MTRAPAYHGTFDDFDVDRRTRSAFVTIALPLDELGRFLVDVGSPVDLDHATVDRQPPCVAVIACRTPVHPETQRDVLLQAACGVLIDDLERHDRPIPPTLAGCIESLVLALRQHPDIAAVTTAEELAS